MERFDRRIYLGLVFIVIAFVPIVLMSFLAIRRVVDEQNRMINRHAQQLLAAERLRYVDSTQSALMPAYVLNGDPEAVKMIEQQNQEFSRLLTQIEQSEDDREIKKLLGHISELSKRLHSYAGPGIALREKGASVADVNSFFVKNANPTAEELNGLLSDLIARETRNVLDAQNTVDSTAREMNVALAGLALLALMLVALISRLIFRAMGQKKAFDQVQRELLAKESRLSQARKETVEVVAHDLKNPLGTTQMSLDLLLDQVAESASKAELQETIGIAKRSADSMQRLIRDLLDHAKIEAGHLVLEKKHGDAAEWARDLLRRFEPLASSRGLKLQAHLRGPLSLSCDYGRIEQVLSNFLGNALKFTPSGGRVNLTVRRENQEALFIVEDTGPGLAPDQLAHVFDRYWQVRETAKQGMGLGLSIAKAVIDAHHGRIWAESEPGHGARFCFALPIAPEVAPSPRSLEMGLGLQTMSAGSDPSPRFEKVEELKTDVH